MASPVDRCVVTTEVSAPRKQRQNRRIPDVCATMGIVCCARGSKRQKLPRQSRWKFSMRKSTGWPALAPRR
ncbi:MAG TPA: hypothetical protein DCL72_00565 [Rhizobiales bacterium]|nr:hypothetical protein [Hyphomicrobiales bacterium]